VRCAESSLGRKVKQLALVAAVAAMPLLTGGCKNFIDPSDVAGRDPQAPRLLVPILKSIDPIDEGDVEFAGAQDVKPRDLQPIKADYIIGANDLITVTVLDLLGQGESVRTSRVSETGKLSLPLVGDPIPAVGLTEQQLQKAIAEEYKRVGILQNAQVTVTVVEALGRTYSIMGTIARPGQYALREADFRLLNALVQAGEVPTQIDYVYVIRKLAAETPSARPTRGPADGAVQPPPPPQGDPLQPRPNPNVPGTDRDPLQPRGDRGGARPILAMVQDSGNRPAPAPAPTSGGGDEKFIIVDGKPVLISPTTQRVIDPLSPTVGTEVLTPPRVAPTTLPIDPAIGQPGYEFGASLQADPEQRVIRVPIQQLRNGDLRYNIIIRPGDIIIVPQPQTGFYYIAGHVNGTGAYSLSGTRMTLKQAIASARMLDPLAVPWKTDIIRRIGDQELYIRVNLTRIFEGKDPDVFIKPNDLIVVGTDFYPPFLQAFRNAFRFTYGFGFIYDRNFAPQQEPADGADNNNGQNGIPVQPIQP
jgi:polysaccharide biosynthesis/export protein